MSNPLSTMSIEQITSELHTFIQSTIVDKKIAFDPETPFHSLGIDSLSIVEMVLFLERKYQLSFPEEELIPENFKSIYTLAICTHRCLQHA